MTRPASRQTSACHGPHRDDVHLLPTDHAVGTYGELWFHRYPGKPDGRSGATPVVVLADASPGREFDVLQTLLKDALGLDVVRIQAAVPPAPVISLSLDDGSLAIGEQLFRPVVVWVRQAAAGAIHSQVARTNAAVGYGLQGAECWARLLAVLTAAAGATLPGPAPGMARQLIDAGRHGVRVPRSVVATDIGAARRMLCAQRVLVKVPDARLFGQRRGAKDAPQPRVVSPADSSPEWMDGTFPAVVQEYVEHASEFRVYYADGGVLAFEVDKHATDSLWTDPARVTVRPANCPARIARIVRSLAGVWGLRYGAFDFLVTRSDEPVFLEVNADGDWLWFERKAGRDPVSFMVATMVAELYSRVMTAEVV
jgi:hypothetical protein